MNQLLLWPVSPTANLVFTALHADLGSITCCDQLEIQLHQGQKSYVVAKNISFCALEKLVQTLQSILVSDFKQASFLDSLIFKKDMVGTLLLELHADGQVLLYTLVTSEMIQGWMAQLDLLQIVMQENENEKKSKGTGCCG